MYVSELHLNNIRCFGGSNRILFSKGINLIVGHNNSGKSTILKAIHNLQGKPKFSILDITFDNSESSIKTIVKNIVENTVKNATFFGKKGYAIINAAVEIKTKISLDSIPNIIVTYNEHPDRSRVDMDYIPFLEQEPINLIFPFLSYRKVKEYSEQVNLVEAKKVVGDFSNLFAKIDKLNNPDKPAYEYFRDACFNVLGFYVSSEQSDTGKFAAFSVDNDRSIPLTSMGDGVANILGLIVDLCSAENKIFLIEELENDIHPKALKALLKLIQEKSADNQFVISTHSNIVVKYLGANTESKVFQVTSETDYDKKPIVPKSRIQEVLYNAQDRIRLLEDLGYDSFDYNQWKGWLFLEESSAEELIRDFFIPTYTPNLLNKLRTHSTQGVDRVESKFMDFNNLFVFIHQDQSYKNRAWVIIDAGTDKSQHREDKIIDTLKKTYLKHGWTEDHFRQFKEHDFEKYYPSVFQAQVNAIEAINIPGQKTQEREKRKEAKANLLNDVKSWINEDTKRAKKLFAESASEIISLLGEIDKVLNSDA